MPIKWLCVCSTDGNVMINVAEIESVENDPNIPDGTSMVRLKSGRSYEVSKSYRELEKIIKYGT